jgi:exopolyphosphatase/guanosine-5'-triphosphate,3'-diphosphate pyrophosphatase
MNANNTKKEITLVAVIDIGSTAIRMVVAETDYEGYWKVLDRTGKILNLGRDVFVNGKISKESLMQAIRVLSGFMELLEGWGIESENVTVIATSAIREAHNRDTFIDRVEVRTGLKVNIAEGIEENRLTYMAVQYAIEDLQPQLSQSNSLIIEVGGGSTEVMLLQHGNIVAAHSLNIGIVRIEQQIKSMPRTGQLERFLQEQVSTTREVLGAELTLSGVEYFVAVGGHARIVADKVGEKVSEWYWIIEKEKFNDFVNQIKQMSIDEIVTELAISYNEADGLVTALIIYQQFVEGTAATSLIVPNVSIREGLLLSMTLSPDQLVYGKFDTQVVASAYSLGRKFHFDENHASHVAHLSLRLFDQLQSIHNLDEHSRLLLHVAGILHDIGTYVRFSGHHKHGQYLVSNSEIFGLYRDDLKIVSNVVRYHRKAMPMPSHVSYISLSREDRIRVLKLSALLRVADALDRGHTQRIQDLSAEIGDDEVQLHCECHGDDSSERLALQKKSDMFEEVFGMDIFIV